MGFKQFLLERKYNEQIGSEVQRCSAEGIPVLENNFRYGSKAFFDVINEARNNGLNDWCLETDLGSFSIYQGKEIPLDFPMFEEELNEEEEPELNKPSRDNDSKKKYKVYVKDGDKIKKISFGDSTGLTVKYNDEEARKSFVARHDCANKKDKTTAGYWSCRIHKWYKQLNLAKPEGNFAYW